MRRHFCSEFDRRLKIGRVIYLTGAPATGKTTVCEKIAARLPGVKFFRFGQQLAAYLSEREGVSPEQLRSGTARFVTPEDVLEVNCRAVTFASTERTTAHVIIDTHAVTRELFGFRMTPISADLILEMSPDMFVTLICTPETQIKRVASKADGRPNLSEWQLSIQAALQNSIPSNYAVLCNKPAYFFENNTNADLNNITENLIRLLTETSTD